MRSWINALSALLFLLLACGVQTKPSVQDLYLRGSNAIRMASFSGDSEWQEAAVDKTLDIFLTSLQPKQLDWLGARAPDLTPDEKAVLKRAGVEDFLLSSMAKAVLATFFSTDLLEFDTPFSNSSQGDLHPRMSQFWNCCFNSSFTAHPGFLPLRDGSLISAWKDGLNATDRALFEPYLASPNASDWAQQLYEFSTTEPILTGERIAYTLSGSAESYMLLPSLMLVLHQLDPYARVHADGDLISFAVALQRSITNITFEPPRSYSLKGEYSFLPDSPEICGDYRGYLMASLGQGYFESDPGRLGQWYRSLATNMSDLSGKQEFVKHSAVPWALCLDPYKSDCTVCH